MAHVYLKEKATYKNHVEKTFSIEWFDIEASFVVNEFTNDWEIERIDVVRGDADAINEIVDMHMKDNYIFEADLHMKECA